MNTEPQAPQEIHLDCCWPLQQVLKMCAFLDYLLYFLLFEVTPLLQVLQLRDHVLHEVPEAVFMLLKLLPATWLQTEFAYLTVSAMSDA